MFKIGAGKCFSAALFVFGAMVLTSPAGPTNVPFSDNFESYPNRTVLTNGINGWYASSNSVIVQTNIVYTNDGGTKAAMIPPYSDLSNRVVDVVNSNIWVSMHVQPCPGMFEQPPTNSTAFFGVGTNGHCFVYNGTNGWTELATALDGSAAPTIDTNQWARFDLRIDHSNHIWALFANYQLLSTNIAFVTNGSSFSGFDVHGLDAVETNYATPSTTSYLDNVVVNYLYPSNLPTQTNNWWLPVMAAVDITNVSRTIWYGQNALSNSFHVQKSSGYLPMSFTNTITYNPSCGVWTDWLSVTPANDISHGEPKTVWLVFNTTNLPVNSQAYQATVQIDGKDDLFGMTASNSPQFITVSVLVDGSSPRLNVSPTNLSNSVSVGYRAPIQQIYVANTSSPPRISIAYSVVSQTNWITNSPASGVVVDETNAVAFTYLTENLAPGWHTGTVTVTASGIATQNVDVVRRVSHAPVLAWNAGQRAWTTNITEGETPSGFTFDVWNGSANPTGTIRFALSDNVDWLALSPASGLSSGNYQNITVAYTNVSGMNPGVYTGIVTLTGVDDSNNASVSNSPLTMVALLTVRGRAFLAIDTDTLTNSVLENYGSTNISAFNIWNAAGVPRDGLIYTVSPDVGWLTVSRSSGIVTNETNAITVVWNGDRPAGTYTGHIVVDGTDELTGSRARGAPTNIYVQMTVLSRTPVNYEKPTIYGTPYIGQTLTARNGLWQNMDRLTFTYQWQRVNNAAGAGLANLSGETTSNYVVVAADKGKYMLIAVTAHDDNPPGHPRSTTVTNDPVSTAKIKATPGDFNGDGITDLWFFDPSTGTWRASFAANSFAVGQFGSAGMIDVPGDYNGDGILDLGLYDSSHAMWYILYLPSGPSLGGSMFGGLAEETQATPVPEDYDGDGQTDIALYWQGYWAILYSTLNRIVVIPPIAGAGAIPAPADYDGDGVTDLGVYDSGLWTIRNVLGEEWSVQFGSSAWIPAPGDYDGDNISDLGIFNQTSNVWSMIYSASGATTNTMFTNSFREFGSSLGANLPRQGYYDHDRYCDPATIHYSEDGDFVIWCVTRTFYINVPYKGINGQTYQNSIDKWRVSW